MVEVRDDGVGGADPANSSGLAGLADRIGAADSELTVVSPPGEGTLVRAAVRVPRVRARAAPRRTRVSRASVVLACSFAGACPGGASPPPRRAARRRPPVRIATPPSTRDRMPSPLGIAPATSERPQRALNLRR